MSWATQLSLGLAFLPGLEHAYGGENCSIDHCDPCELGIDSWYWVGLGRASDWLFMTANIVRGSWVL